MILEQNFLSRVILLAQEIGKIDKNAKLGSHKDKNQIWYNASGDCIQFQTVHDAIVAERIDEYLTIYRSAVNNQPIGFQLKDVKALINKYRFEGIVVKASVSEDALVSATSLLVRILTDSVPSIGRRDGYTEAIETIRDSPKEEDDVKVPV